MIDGTARTATIGVSFTPNGGAASQVIFDNFGGTDIPRIYSDAASFSKSANGTSIISGPAYRQKYIWPISSVLTNADAIKFDGIFTSWDTDRSNGLSAAVGVTDQTFGTAVTTSAIFSTPPTYTRMGPNHTMVSFGLTEV